MDIKDLIETPGELIRGAEAPGAVVLSTRIRLARNLNDYPFPSWAKESQRSDILSRCEAAVVELPKMKGGTHLDVADLSDLEKQILVERHLISRELGGGGRGSGVLVSQDQSCSIMVNEEDHLRIQVVRSGFHFKSIWKLISEVDSGIEDSLNFAFNEDLGYLTACPTNVGTGMRASVMMHLPGLVISNQMEKVIRAVNQLGIAVRGLFGEGSDASGSIFQISNQQTLGESEETIIRRLGNVLNTVIEQEENARLKLLEGDSVKLFDKIGRAYGTLRNGHLLSSAEAMNYLSLMRLAIDLNILPESVRMVVDRLFIESQPGHIQYAANRSIDSSKRDIARADLLRDKMRVLPLLDFDNLLNS